MLGVWFGADLHVLRIVSSSFGHDSSSSHAWPPRSFIFNVNYNNGTFEAAHHVIWLPTVMTGAGGLCVLLVI